MTTNTPHENPFKLFKLFLKVITIILIISALIASLHGCAPKPRENTHTIERIVEHGTDSVNNTKISKAILDSLVIQLAKVKTAKPDCDSITQATLNQVLSQLNSRKKSGDNEAGIKYDEKLKQIIAWLKTAESKTEKVYINRYFNITKKEKQIVKVPVKYTPWWVKSLAFIGFLTLLWIGWRISSIWRA